MGSSQKRAIQNYRSRLSERGLARFEVLGRDADRDLIRSLARRLAEDGPDASRLRAAVSQTIAGEPPKKGGILAALESKRLDAVINQDPQAALMDCVSIFTNIRAGRPAQEGIARPNIEIVLRENLP